MGVLPHEIYLLDLPYTRESQQGWQYSLQRYPWKKCPSYDVLEYMHVESDSHDASILINNEPITIKSSLADALAHVVRQGESRRLWIENLCLEHQRALNSKERSEKIKFYRTSAQIVTMWIGKDEEQDDVLSEYLGPGTISSTDAAFSFCRRLAEIEDPQEDLGSAAQWQGSEMSSGKFTLQTMVQRDATSTDQLRGGDNFNRRYMWNWSG